VIVGCKISGGLNKLHHKYWLKWSYLDDVVEIGPNGRFYGNGISMSICPSPKTIVTHG